MFFVAALVICLVMNNSISQQCYGASARKQEAQAIFFLLSRITDGNPSHNRPIISCRAFASLSRLYTFCNLSLGHLKSWECITLPRKANGMVTCITFQNINWKPKCKVNLIRFHELKYEKSWGQGMFLIVPSYKLISWLFMCLCLSPASHLFVFEGVT